MGRHIERPLEGTSLDIHDKDLNDEIYTPLMFQTYGALSDGDKSGSPILQ